MWILTGRDNKIVMWICEKSDLSNLSFREYPFATFVKGNQQSNKKERKKEGCTYLPLTVLLYRFNLDERHNDCVHFANQLFVAFSDLNLLQQIDAFIDCDVGNSPAMPKPTEWRRSCRRSSFPKTTNAKLRKERIYVYVSRKRNLNFMFQKCSKELKEKHLFRAIPIHIPNRICGQKTNYAADPQIIRLDRFGIKRLILKCVPIAGDKKHPVRNDRIRMRKRKLWESLCSVKLFTLEGEVNNTGGCCFSCLQEFTLWPLSSV
ncbi:hypothetical protein G5I_08698 [Acromyrmex echinatior]|uniref:Uncharacterized protein n=1 Tax=Acromyrmex echinatior TaxID=103372 RepID=F4WS82_ACREC|nr:hypothetical protein G5I_08698 [Acromyrmex echinatior]